MKGKAICCISLSAVECAQHGVYKLTVAPILALRQALRQKAAMWTTPGEQPPLFYFMRKDLTDYLAKARTGCCV